jgi:hypothetical protein
MDTILFLESIVHFYSCTRYIVLYMGRVCRALTRREPDVCTASKQAGRRVTRLPYIFRRARQRNAPSFLSSRTGRSPYFSIAALNLPDCRVTV